MAWEKLGTASVSGTTANTSWKELDRATVSSGDTLDTSTFTAKDNMMILCYTVGSGTVHPKLHFNNDTGSNYAFRYSGNGGSDSTSTSQDYFRIQGGISGSPTQFSVSNVVNVSSQEKLITSHLIANQNTGAGNAPTREENVGKWANTSAQINRVDCDNGQSGDYASGTELVVLGYDNDEADSGTNFWQELGKDELTSASGSMSKTIAAKKYLMVEWFANADGGNNVEPRIRFNDDSGSNYANRINRDGTGEATNTNQSNITTSVTDHNTDEHGIAYIINVSDKEKLVISHSSADSGWSSGYSRRETVGKWVNTSAQITNVKIYNNNTNNLGSGSWIRIYGAD